VFFCHSGELDDPKALRPAIAVIPPTDHHVTSVTVVIEAAPIQLEFDPHFLAACANYAIWETLLYTLYSDWFLEFVYFV
jgi:hypothetical protein